MSKSNNTGEVQILNVTLLAWLGKPVQQPAPVPAPTAAPASKQPRTFSVNERAEAIARAQRARCAQDLNFKTR